jgi:hypothetical protein
LGQRRHNLISGVILIVVSAFGISAHAQTQKPPNSTSKADKAADQILAEQKEEEGLSWYGDVYPALKRKYSKPVSRQIYDSWRDKFFNDVVMPAASKKGYDTSHLRDDFMKATEKQPSN